MTMTEAANLAGKQLYHLRLISTDMAPIHISMNTSVFNTVRSHICKYATRLETKKNSEP